MKAHDGQPVWLLRFTLDLRVQDNSALLYAANNAKRLLCVYCIDEQCFRPNLYTQQGIAGARWHFLQQSLQDLQTSLEALGQQLLVCYGEPVQALSKIIELYHVEHLVQGQTSLAPEQAQLDQLAELHPHLSMHLINNRSLFNHDSVPVANGFPRSFSKFRSIAEKLLVDSPEPAPKQLPAGLPITVAKLPSLPSDQRHPDFKGGEQAGLAHLERYFASNLASSYKQTRNALDDWTSSCKFSPWLALGCVSPKQVVHQLLGYEQQHGRNDSSYWIFFELLWREFFHHYARYYGQRLYRFSGINANSPLTSYYPQRFLSWSQGSTPWPLVNAGMKQLNQTGYISNRMRQIVASALVNELALDWRCGAHYFAQQLIDYDEAVNWGNWQYIAGVGADPRDGRHFNLEHQQQTYDPDGAYITRWQGNTAASTVVDSVDAADWPVS
ncbi:DASH family cryptochrome [Aliagarivorans marinus]|uniref:DASH family cryptochrome n=1 Tax=Aliagarivorans marinus TaxID=561965 RepID=UPI0003FEFE03|nr:DASH family cryptochrome [Aliagarivorans marinus]